MEVTVSGITVYVDGNRAITLGENPSISLENREYEVVAVELYLVE
jgi:hypothetical protein